MSYFNDVKAAVSFTILTTLFLASINTFAQQSDISNRMRPGRVQVPTEIQEVPAVEQPNPWTRWCQNLPDRLSEVLSVRYRGGLIGGGEVNSPAGRRAYLKRSVRALMNENAGHGETVYPLTYRVLQLIDRMLTFPSEAAWAPFPNTLQGNQSANIVARELLQEAQRISVSYDQETYIVVYQSCPHFGCESEQVTAQQAPDYFVNYLGAAHQILSAAWGVVPGSGGTVLDGMGENLWELKAHAVLIRWLQTMLESSAFRRRTGAMVTYLMQESDWLDSFLGSSQSIHPAILERNVGLARNFLAQVYDGLDEITREGQVSCTLHFSIVGR